jgi:hypothetical protein
MAQFVSAGGNGKNGKVSTLGADDQPVVELTATDTDSIVEAGQTGRPARLSLYDTNHKETVRATAADGRLIAGGNGTDSRITARGSDNLPVAELIATATTAVIGAGQTGRPARISLYDTNAKETVRLTASDGKFSTGGNGVNSRITARGSDNLPVAELIATATTAVIGAGQKGRPARISLYDTNQQETVRVTASNGKLVMGGGGVNSRITARGKDNQPCAELIATDTESIIGAGQKSRPARISLYDAEQHETVRVTASNGKIVMGGNGVNSRITARGKDNQPCAELIATDTESIIGAGQKGRPARISLYDTNQKETIRLDAAAGDIILFNADLAEEFDVDDDVEPGSVVVLDADGVVRCSAEPYDSRVVGVVSGGGPFRPGIVLDRRSTDRPRRPIAVMGKVGCLVDATSGPIRVGDLLTTSPRAGHAMRATDRDRAFGAVVGKALRSLERGIAVIPVLVTLQ